MVTHIIYEIGQEMKEKLHPYQFPIWEGYLRAYGGEAFISLWREWKQLNQENGCVYEQQKNYFGEFMFQNFGYPTDSTTPKLLEALGGEDALYKENYRDIVRAMEERGFELWVWFSCSSAADPLNPFICLRVSPTDDSLWFLSQASNVFGSCFNSPYHITVSNFKDILPLREKLRELKEKYEFPKKVVIKPDEFYFTSGQRHIMLNTHCELYQDVALLNHSGSDGYKFHRANPFDIHITL